LSEIGFLEAESIKGHPGTLSGTCRKSLDELRKKLNSDINIFEISSVRLRKKYRGLGIGKQIYERALRLAWQNNAGLIPNSCMEHGKTSESAKNVWLYLKGYYVSEGNIVIFKIK
jgi:GNAT superfamily N-acetyltransferase